MDRGSDSLAGDGAAPGAEFFLDLIPDLDARAAAYDVASDEAGDEVQRLFREQLDLAIRALLAAADGRDAAAIRRAAHTLTGMGGAAGAPVVSVAGDELGAAARRGDFERCRALAERLSAWAAAGMRSGPRADRAAAVEGPRLSGRVMVVDDEYPNRAFLRGLLTNLGLEVADAADGPAAIELGRQWKPDLALVDVVMPGMSGYDVCRRLVTDPEAAGMAVIMVTARSAVEDVERAFELGAFDYIRKPFHARELVARVRNALQLKQQNDALRQWQFRISHEMEMAGSLQRKILNTAPFFHRTTEFRIAYQSSMSVGGDVFDVLQMPDGRMCFYVADVAGHGVGPAMVSTLLKAVISEVTRERAERGPAALCSEIQRRFRHYVANPEIYATLFLAIMDTADGRCVAFNCGHPAPMACDAAGAPLRLFADRGGLPIGLAGGSDADGYAPEDEVEAVLPAGASLFVFTDGLLEARRAEDPEPCGEGNLLSVLSDVARDPDIADPAQAALQRLTERGYRLAQDDCTLISARRCDRATVRLERAIAPTHDAVARLAAEVEATLRREDWPEESAGAARLLVMEHGANAVDHGGFPAGEFITLRLRVTPGRAWLLFRDHGQAWDFEERLSSALRQSGTSVRGRGLQIIRAIADHVDAVRRERRNEFLFTVARDFSVATTGRREREETP